MTITLDLKFALSDGTSKTFSIVNPKLDEAINFPDGIFGTGTKPTEPGVIAKIRKFTQDIIKTQGLGSAWEPKVLDVEDCQYVFEYKQDVISGDGTESWEEDNIPVTPEPTEQEEIVVGFELN